MRLKTVSIVLVALVPSLQSSSSSSSAFEWSAAGGGGRHPEVDRLALAGLWKLTPRISPMKEFTVYPKMPAVEKPPDLLLMLKEDGSFQQYNNDKVDVDVDASWSKFQLGKKKGTLEQVTKGTWDFLDGKLILAADRPESPEKFSSPLSSSSSSSSQQQDKLLVGRVVATYETSLEGNPVLRQSSDNQTMSGAAPAPNNQAAFVNNNPPSSKSAAAAAASAMDAHLSVPRGSIQIGRFMYPKTHPSFFEQPMFQPTVRRQAFSLQQVLGSLNARRRHDEQSVEKYQNSDFYNKTFFLTSHPLPPRKKPQGGGGGRNDDNNQRWKSLRAQRAQQQQDEEDEANAPVPIRVMQVVFHRNHTFSTVAGLGEAILRGKWDVIGSDKDQLWMQVWRFGFGRSVSGSTYSEGLSLTQDDAKCYWGTIRNEVDGGERENEERSIQPGNASEMTQAAISPADADGGIASTSPQVAPDEDKPERLEVRGSVMFGWGLEPLPVARFIMRESTQQLDDDVDDEGEDENDEDSTILERLEENDSNLGPSVEGIDWTDEAFQ